MNVPLKCIILSKVSFFNTCSLHWILFFSARSDVVCSSGLADLQTWKKVINHNPSIATKTALSWLDIRQTTVASLFFSICWLMMPLLSGKQESYTPFYKRFWWREKKKIQLRQVRRGGSLSFPNSHVAYKSYTPLYLGAFVYDSFTKGKYVLIIDSQDFQNIDQLSNLLTCNNYKIKWIKLVYKY